MFLERLKTIFDGWLAVKPKQPIDSSIQPIVCFGTITENCFVLWLSIKWFYNWLRSSFKCFDQSLKAINSLLCLCNKQELRFNQRKRYLSFSLIFLLKSWRLLWDCFWLRKCGIGFLTCIDFRSFCNKCNPFVLCENSVCEAEKCCVLLRFSRSAFLVVFVLSQRKCVSWRDQGHFFGGVVSNLGLVT